MLGTICSASADAPLESLPLKDLVLVMSPAILVRHILLVSPVLLLEPSEDTALRHEEEVDSLLLSHIGLQYR